MSEDYNSIQIMGLSGRLKVIAAEVLKVTKNGLLYYIRRMLWPTTIPQYPKKICVHRVGQIGDIICALPAIATIRQKFKDAELVLLTSPGSKGSPNVMSLVSKLHWIDRVKSYFSEDVNSLDNLKRFIKDLREERFDLWIQLPQDLTKLKIEIRNMIFVKILGVPWAGGFRVNTSTICLKEQARALTFKREDEVLIELLKDLKIQGNFIDSDYFEFKANDDFEKKLVSGLPKRKAEVLALAPGGKRVLNRWPIEHFAEIGRRWMELGGWVVVVGGEKERILGQSIEEKCTKQSILNLCGKTTVLETTEILKKCGALVTNDSGPMHLAALVKTPCIAVFSGRDFSNKWSPRGDGHTVFRNQVDCSPCFLEECPNGHLCLTNIQVDEVWNAVIKTTRNRYVSVI